jgi:hypothetical protein
MIILGENIQNCSSGLALFNPDFTSDSYTTYYDETQIPLLDDISSKRK